VTHAGRRVNQLGMSTQARVPVHYMGALHGARILALALLAAGCATGPARPTAPPTVELWEWGRYEVASHAGDAPAPRTTMGTVHVVPPLDTPRLLERTERIPAAVGMRFGVRFIARQPGGPSIIPLRVRVLHPPTRNPATGRVTEREEWDAEANASLPRFTGWLFEAPWEVAPGPWTIQILDRERDLVLAEKTFIVSE
jgi:Domain of unknown function (DUF3859)